MAVILLGTTDAQTSITATLGGVTDGMDLEPPVVAVIGEVVALSERLRWWSPRSVPDTSRRRSPRRK